MKKFLKPGLIVPLIVIVAVLVWAFDSTRIRTYTSQNTNIGLGSGVVTLTNPADEAASVELSASGTRGAFSIIGSITDNSAVNSVREGSGRNVEHKVTLDLPPGESTLRVARGSGVTMNISAASPVAVVVNPFSEGDLQSTAVVALVVILVMLFIMSNSVQHKWIGWVRQRLTGGKTTASSPESERASA